MSLDITAFDPFSDSFSLSGMVDATFKLLYTYVKMILHLPYLIFKFYLTGIELFFAMFKYHLFTMPARPLHNETCLVVGSDTLLGRSFSERCVKMRGTVICVDSSKDRGDTFVKSLNDANPGAPKAYFYECDVTNNENVKEVIQTITKDLGDITILINCMEKNLIATYYNVFKLVLPSMVGNKKGALVFIRTADYATRTAVQALHDSIAKELKDAKADKYVSSIVAHVFPQIAVTSDGSGLFGVARPENVAKSILEGVARNRKEIFLPGFMIYCIFWIKFLPSIITSNFEHFLFGTHGSPSKEPVVQAVAPAPVAKPVAT